MLMPVRGTAALSFVIRNHEAGRVTYRYRLVVSGAGTDTTTTGTAAVGKGAAATLTPVVRVGPAGKYTVRIELPGHPESLQFQVTVGA